MPRSMRPVTTVPRPEIENTSSTGIKKRLGPSDVPVWDVGVDRVQSSLRIESCPCSGDLFSSAMSAEPLMIGMSSPGIRSEKATRALQARRVRASSGSSTMSTLLRVDDERGTPTWRARRMCSRGLRHWAVGGDENDQDRAAPICAAPVIMFLHVVGVARANRHARSGASWSRTRHAPSRS